MYFRVREFFSYLAFAILVYDLCKGQRNESTYRRRDIELLPTYQTGIERAIGDFVRYWNYKPSKNETIPAEDKTVGGYNEAVSAAEKNFHAVFPGTVWCGSGSVANHDKDIGFFDKVDSCCREHDKCPIYIRPGKSLGPLVNNGTFARSHCFCEHEFQKCLKRLGTRLSLNIGSTYFNILRPQCFVLEHPIVSCLRYSNPWFTSPKCLDYKIDRSRPKKLQWFDGPDF